jgi:hypothetical protein
MSWSATGPPAREGNQPAQLLPCVSRGSLQIPLQTGDVGVRIRLLILPKNSNGKQST